jgi:ketosteroid isomerase-like protein
MRLLQVLFICLCCLQIHSTAQQTSPEAAKLLALEAKWTEAYQVRSINTLISLLAEDFVITVEDGRVFGKLGYVSHTADPSVRVETAEQSDLRVHLHGNIAIITGAYHETGTAKNKRYEYRDRFTDVWIKTNGQWQLIASQYSVPLQQ